MQGRERRYVDFPRDFPPTSLAWNALVIEQGWDIDYSYLGQLIHRPHRTR
jgi:hypothetical protein